MFIFKDNIKFGSDGGSDSDSGGSVGGSMGGGGGIGLNFSGTDWLGIGRAVGDASKSRNEGANAICGPKPLCISVFSEDCVQKKQIHSKCLADQQAMSYNLQSSNLRRSAMSDERKHTVKIISIVSISIVVLVVALIISNRKKQG